MKPNFHTSENVVHISRDMFTHESEIAISTVSSKLKDFSRSQAVTYIHTVKVIINSEAVQNTEVVTTDH